MLVSVIVPVYNMAADDKLTYCMNSLVGQTLTRRGVLASGEDQLEILAIDDCSTDSSLEILRQYEKEYPDVVHVYQTPQNLHQGGAKNIGLSHAKGDWIAFIDADDWVVPDYFERLLNKAKETGADCVGTDYSMTPEHSMKVGQIVHNNKPMQTGVLDDAKYRSLMIDFGSLCVKIYKREIILDCPSRFPEGIFYEDNALAKTWISRMKHFEYIEEPLYYYYQHEDSTVHTVTKARLTDRITSGRIMLKEAKTYGYFDKFRPELEYSFTVLFYKNTLFSCLREMKEAGAYAFVTALAQEMKATFPSFRENPYYQDKTDPEEKKLMDLQMKSPWLFYMYYRLLWFYRDHLRRG